MSNDIKAGDLVMIVKPQTCCGSVRRIGQVFTVGEFHSRPTICGACGARRLNLLHAKDFAGGLSCEATLLIKINPPAEGDSLPTRVDLEVPA